MADSALGSEPACDAGALANAWLARQDHDADVESPTLLASLYALLEGQEAVAASEAAGFAL